MVIPCYRLEGQEGVHQAEQAFAEVKQQQKSKLKQRAKGSAQSVGSASGAGASSTTITAMEVVGFDPVTLERASDEVLSRLCGRYGMLFKPPARTRLIHRLREIAAAAINAAASAHQRAEDPYASEDDQSLDEEAHEHGSRGVAAAVAVVSPEKSAQAAEASEVKVQTSVRRFGELARIRRRVYETYSAESLNAVIEGYIHPHISCDLNAFRQRYLFAGRALNSVPSVLELQQFLQTKLQWTPLVTEQKLLRLLVFYDLFQGRLRSERPIIAAASAESDGWEDVDIAPDSATVARSASAASGGHAQANRRLHFTPVAVLKKKTVRGTGYFVLQWRREEASDLHEHVLFPPSLEHLAKADKGKSSKAEQSQLDSDGDDDNEAAVAERWIDLDYAITEEAALNSHVPEIDRVIAAWNNQKATQAQAKLDAKAALKQSKAKGRTKANVQSELCRFI